MSDPKREAIQSDGLNKFKDIYLKATTKEKKDLIWNGINTPSASLCSKRSELEDMVNTHVLKNTDTFFCLEAGVFENVPVECRFEDGFIQAFSINESNKQLSNYMREKGILSTFYEFIGGHNYVCYRGSISDRIKEVFKIRYSKHKNFNYDLRSKL